MRTYIHAQEGIVYVCFYTGRDKHILKGKQTNKQTNKSKQGKFMYVVAAYLCHEVDSSVVFDSVWGWGGGGG